MNESIHQVMSAGVHTKQLAIQHVRQGRDGMPVAYHWLSEGINEAVSRQARFDFLVLGDELRIVVIDEVVMPHRPVHTEGDCEEQRTEQKFDTHPGKFSWKRRQKTMSKNQGFQRTPCRWKNHNATAPRPINANRMRIASYQLRINTTEGFLDLAKPYPILAAEAVRSLQPHQTHVRRLGPITPF
ncbi:MAG: hypothetical protein QM813_12475 [Verrucomicrobiota bacterium]